MSDLSPRRAGRPRKYQSTGERVRAFRSAHGLCKVTIDVPSGWAWRIKRYAQMLRRNHIDSFDEGPDNQMGKWEYVDNNEIVTYWWHVTIKIIKNSSTSAYEWKVIMGGYLIIARGRSKDLQLAKNVSSAVARIYYDRADRDPHFTY